MSKFPLFKVFMSNTAIKNCNKTLRSGMITQASKVEEFETKLQNFLQNKHILTLNSATSGLTLALKMLKDKIPELNWNGFDTKNDIILTPSLTCFATTASILNNECNIRWIDTDPNTANINFDDLKTKINEKTKIIYIVYWGGNTCSLEELNDIKIFTKNKFGFEPFIVEDCAHSFGAYYRNSNKLVGSPNGNIQVFSLQAIKLLTTGDGGLICLPNEELYNRTKLLRWYGINRNARNYNYKDFRLENDIVESGFKYHMNDISASLGISNLDYIPKLLKKNRKNGVYLKEKLKDLVKVLDQHSSSSFWLFSIKINNKFEFIEFMKEQGIQTSQVHQRNDIFSVCEKYKEDLPLLDQLEKELVCIPCGYWLNKKDLDFIVSCIEQFLKINLKL